MYMHKFCFSTMCDTFCNVISFFHLPNIVSLTSKSNPSAALKNFVTAVQVPIAAKTSKQNLKKN